MESLNTYLKDSPYVKKLKKVLSVKRYDHTIRVAHVAYAMAKAHNYSSKKAVVAALLHDYAKNHTVKKLLHECDKYHIECRKSELANPELLHAKVGAKLAAHEFHIEDADILNAIKYHTTGRPGMGKLEKIIFISDYIEPARNHKGNLDDIRVLAYENLDETVYLILKEILEHLNKKSKAKDPMTKKNFSLL